MMEPWSMPEPLLPVAIVAHAKADEDKLGTALQRLAAEDPTVRIEHNPETHQLVLWCMGEAHADVLLDRLRNRYGVQVDQVDVRVPLRETFAGRGQGDRAATSSRAAGTASTPCATSRSSRSAPGAGFEFVDKVVGGVGAAAVHPQRREGRPRPAGAGPRGRLPGRRHPGHPVRRQGAQRRLQRHGVPDRGCPGAARGRRRRPACSCSSRSTRSTILIDDDFVGAVMGDLSTRRARVLGTEPVGTRPHAGQGRDPAARARPLRHRPAVAEPRHRHVLPALRPLRADALATSPRSCWPRTRA